MADIDKVIKCLEACTGDSGDCAGHTCPYWNFDGDIGCRTQMELDALALLKQEAVEPIRISTNYEQHWKCGNCKAVISVQDKYCHECGKRIQLGRSVK